MLVSEYIAKFFADLGVKYAFGVTGTAVNMCFVAIGRQKEINYVCPLHEQAAAMAADGYSRVSGTIALAISTSGPGATNLITGCAGAYTDSVPVVFITGQAPKKLLKGNTGLRFYGFQELDNAAIFKPITKYSTQVETIENVRYELEKAVSIAMSGRKGPVMLSFPEDILYSEIKPSEQKGYLPSEFYTESRTDIGTIVNLFSHSSRPILLFGGGIHNGNSEREVRILAEKLGWPVAMSYPARDLFPDDYDGNVGSIGIFGSRSGNFAIQNADFILSIGCRLDSYAVGQTNQFARSAKIVAVDIDEKEAEKYRYYGLPCDLSVCRDSKQFITDLLFYMDSNKICLNEYSEWKEKIRVWKRNYPLCPESYFKEEDINPYAFFNLLSSVLKENDIIFADTGLSAVWIGQSFKFKYAQRFFTQFSFSSMGYSLPAAMGACFAVQQRIICVTGDGGLQMNIQELATVAYHSLNLKIFVICNDGYGLIQKTQDDYDNGHHATDRENGVALPVSGNIAGAYGIRTVDIWKNDEIICKLNDVFSDDYPVFCSVHIPISKKISPRRQGSSPIEDMTPKLDRETFCREMITLPVTSCTKRS